MKLNYALSFIFLFFLLYSHSQIVDIPDANFKNALLTDIEVNTNGDDEIQVSEAEAAEFIAVDGMGIASLEGINSFVNITSLYCENNNLTTIDISSLSQLEVLWAAGNTLESISFSTPSNLESIRLGNNSISDLSVFELESLSMLEELDLSNNPLGPSFYLEQGSLKEIILTNCGIETIDLSGMGTLENVFLDQNPLGPALSLESGSLEYLYVNDCGLEMLNISGLTNLSTLSAALNNLSEISLDENKLLEVVLVSNNSLTELDVSNNPLVHAIWVGNNNLIELNMKNGLVSESYELFSFNGNPDLSFICADDGEFELINDKLETYGYDDVTVSSDCSLDIEEFESSISWSMYPNPTAGTLYIASSNVQINSVEIYDHSGRAIHEFTPNAMEVNLRLEELAASVYFVKVETNIGSSIKRLVKQ